MLANQFSRQLKVGQMGESAIALWLRGRGWAVLPVYDVEIETGKGPRLFAPTGQLIAPDMLVYRANEVLWIEAKHKTAFSWHRISGQWVTGIDLRHYAHYCEIEDLSPWPVWLIFLHRGGQAKDSPPSPSGLFGNRLCVLRKSENHRSEKYGRGGMVYWAMTALRQLGNVREDGSIY